MNLNPLELLKNAQEIQKRLAEAQDRLAAISVTGSAGGGMVEVTLNGKLEALKVKISPDAFAAARTDGLPDPGMLEDLVLMAMRDANARVREAMEGELGAMAGMPGLGGLMSGMPGGLG
jgi:DNA-binding YbaB/EbfC family protein